MPIIRRVGFSAEVPGNVSRYFTSREEALEQPIGHIQLAWNDDSPLLFNQDFDPAIVRHDANYSTTSVSASGTSNLPTVEYFHSGVAKFLSADSSVIDIGCGQGEFVGWLESHGVKATGFDPVLWREGPNLFKRYWSRSEAPADLYVLRCVLPHIPNPWDFLKEVAHSSENAMVLVEYQRLDFITNNDLWFQMSHDHVNQFQLSDFSDRYELLGHGIFANEEWEWVLFRPASFSPPRARSLDLHSSLAALVDARARALESLANLDCPIAVWGAAGKGVVFAHSLVAMGVEDVVMIDADPAKSGLYAEGSGSLIVHSSAALSELALNTEVVVVNPNHWNDVNRLVGMRFRPSKAADWSQQ